MYTGYNRSTYLDSSTAAAKLIYGVGNEGTMNSTKTTKWFQRFPFESTSLVDKPGYNRPVTTNTDTLFYVVEENPETGFSIAFHLMKIMSPRDLHF